jgi:ABC-type dipeptide/oligopeptide/nickel transport system permease subunit
MATVSDASTHAAAAARMRPIHPALRRLRGRPLVIAAMATLMLFIILALAAPVIAPHDPTALIIGAVMRPPSWAYPFGTDELGRDVFSRVIHGARISLQIGVITISIALALGTLVGLAAGFYGGVVDGALMAVMEILLAFPQILLAMAILAMLGPSLRNAMIAVGLSAVPVYARTARGTTLSVRSMDYVEAARAVGAGDGRILLRYVLPNMISPVVVLATAGVGIAILIAAGLSYLGLGAQPPTPEWGAMLSESRAYLRHAWWMATFPGLAITVVVVSLNLCGDWLRDLLDPRLRR